MTRATSSVVAGDNFGICTLLEIALGGRLGFNDDEREGETRSTVGADVCKPEEVPWAGGAVSIDAGMGRTPCCCDISPPVLASGAQLQRAI